MLKDQQMHFGFMDVILLYSGHQHVSATHMATFRVVCLNYSIVLKSYSFGSESRLNNKMKK